MAIASRPLALENIQETVRFVDLRRQTAALKSELTAAIEGVLDRGDFILGDDVERFEHEFAAYCGVPHAVGVDSGFSALELALRAAGIGPGDEVITQANTFIATVSAIQAVGATPVLVDCDEHGSYDPAAFAAAIGPRTKALVPVHLFGRIGDIDAMATLAAAKGLLLLEDACQAHGATLEGRRGGSFGQAAAFSFYPGKNLGAFGDGGGIVTTSPEIAKHARTVRHYGQAVKYEHETTPLNRRLDTIQAAILRIKLRHLDTWIGSRSALALEYGARLEGLPLWAPPKEEAGRHVYHLYIIETPERDRVRQALSAANVETGIHYPIPLHQQPVLSGLGYRAGEFPNTERLAAQMLSLPMYPELPIEHLERVTAVIWECIGG